MIYLHDRNKDRKKKRFYIGLFIAALVVILSATGVFGKLGGLFQRIAKPMWKAENAVQNGAENAGYVIRTKASVYNENEILKAKNQELEGRMVEYGGLLIENAELKSELENKELLH